MIDVSKLGHGLFMKDIDLDTLIEDAIERGNPEALAFLQAESSKVVIRQKKSKATGEVVAEYESLQSISSYRAKYLKKYCGYVPAGQRPSTPEEREIQRQRRKAKKMNTLSNKFADAFSKMNTNNAE